MKLTNFTLATSFIALSLLSSAQEIKTEPTFDTYHKNVYVEFLGSSLGVGFNYDMRLNKGKMDGIGFRAGIGGFNFNGKDKTNNPYELSVVTIPLEFNHLVGKKTHFFKSGIGLLPAYARVAGVGDASSNKWVEADGFGLAGGFLTLGYERQPLKNGLMFQAQLNPMIIRGSGMQVGWIGLGIGYGFK